MAIILNFSNTLKKSLAHLHIVGNVIIKYEYFLSLSFVVFAPTKKFGVDLWRPFLNLVASLKKSLAHPHVARNVMLN